MITLRDAGRHRAALPGHDERAGPDGGRRTRPTTPRSWPTSRPRWSTGTSATSRVFQSLPDNWAIDQLFPIMPIHRLDEEPTRRGTLAGHHLRFGRRDRPLRRADGRASPRLELHPIRDGEPYILGIFLTGAYQEILGDLHNLFGDTNAVHIRLTDERLRDHRPGARRHGHRGAQLRAVPRRRAAQQRSGARWPTPRTSRGTRPTRSSRTTWRGWRGTRTWRGKSCRRGRGGGGGPKAS